MTKKYRYQYRLTDSTRQLTSFINDTYSDEKSQILYSKQNLSGLGLEVVTDPPSLLEKSNKYYINSTKVYLKLILFTLSMSFCWLLIVCFLFIYRKTIKMLKFVPIEKLRKATGIEAKKYEQINVAEGISRFFQSFTHYG